MDFLDVNIKVPVAWFYLSAIFIFAAAIATFGVDTFVRGWLREGLIKNRVIIIFADIFAVLQCIVVGAIVGIVVWNPILTGAFGLLGSLGYKLFMKIIRAYLGKQGISLDTQIIKNPNSFKEKDSNVNDNTLDLPDLKF